MEHRTTYPFDRPVALGPHVVRLRPAPHTRTPIESYSLHGQPRPSTSSTGSRTRSATTWPGWSSPSRPTELEITVDLVADLTVINPFDFFVEEYAERCPFAYEPRWRHGPRALPGDRSSRRGPRSATGWLADRRLARRRRCAIVDFLVRLNQRSTRDVAYTVRMEPGVQTPGRRPSTWAIGSCRDSAWLLVAALRAARPGGPLRLRLPGPAGRRRRLARRAVPARPRTSPTCTPGPRCSCPGAGWVGLDPTSGAVRRRGPHPARRRPRSRAARRRSPGRTDPCRGHVRVPPTSSAGCARTRGSRALHRRAVARIARSSGARVDERLAAGDVAADHGRRADLRLGRRHGRPPSGTSPPTVPTSASWPGQLAGRLWPSGSRPAALVHAGRASGTPASRCRAGRSALHWRTDGEPLWRDPELLDDPCEPGRSAGRPTPTTGAAGVRARRSSPRSACRRASAVPAYEDPLRRSCARDARRAAKARQPTEPTAGPDLAHASDAAERQPGRLGDAAASRAGGRRRLGDARPGGPDAAGCCWCPATRRPGPAAAADPRSAWTRPGRPGRGPSVHARLRRAGWPAPMRRRCPRSSSTRVEAPTDRARASRRATATSSSSCRRSRSSSTFCRAARGCSRTRRPGDADAGDPGGLSVRRAIRGCAP